MFGELHTVALSKKNLFIPQEKTKPNIKQTNSCTAFDSQAWLFLIGETKKPKF